MKMIIDIPEEKAELLSENIEAYGGKIEYLAKDMVYDPYTDNFVGQMIDDKLKDDSISKEQYPELFDEKFQDKIVSNVFDKIEEAFNNGLGIGYEDASDIVDTVVGTYVDRLDILRASINEKDSSNDRTEKFDLIINKGVYPLSSEAASFYVRKMKELMDTHTISNLIREFDDSFGDYWVLNDSKGGSFTKFVQDNLARVSDMRDMQRVSSPIGIKDFADKNNIYLTPDCHNDEFTDTYDFLQHLNYEVKQMTEAMRPYVENARTAEPVPTKEIAGMYMKKILHLADVNTSPYAMPHEMREGIKEGVSMYCAGHPEVVAYMNPKKQTDKTKNVAKER